MTNVLDPTGKKLDEVERRKHLVSIEKLAQQSGVSQTEIGKLYAEELERVLDSTKIRDFLPILIERKVKQDLNKNLQHSS
jgi:hypothetical protein